MRVAVTGANGFIGTALLAHMATNKPWDLLALARRPPESGTAGVAYQAVGDMSQPNCWPDSVKGVSALVHTAAKAHRKLGGDPSALAELRQVNVVATLELARIAAESGVRRFVFLSSIKVNGESTQPGKPIMTGDEAAPQDDYAASKWDAEIGLRSIAAASGMELVIVRPPLVYGPGVGANFLRLLHWVGRGIPLPLASVRNKRSLIFLGNLVDALWHCLEQEAAIGRTFFVSDSETFSTPELIETLASAMGNAPGLWSCPPSWLGLGANLLGLGPEMDRLTQSLEVDSSSIRATLGWTPPYSASSGIAQTVEWYRQAHMRET